MASENLLHFNMKNRDKKGKFVKGHIPRNKNKGIGWIEKGYRILNRNGKAIQEHRLIWKKYHGKIPKDYQIHHKNGNKKDNRIENLQLLNIKDHTRFHNNGFQKGHPDIVGDSKKRFACKRCKYIWIPRVNKPIKCPYCKNLKWNT